MNRIAAIVILYNYDKIKFLLNLDSYKSQVIHVFIIDNSDDELIKERVHWFEDDSKISYVLLNENKGVAYALNIGINIAIQNQFQWAITFDQDSVVPDLLIKRMYSVLSSNDYKLIGIISPNISLFKDCYADSQGPEIEEMKYVITSGSLMNLEAFNNVGAFDEKMFIDWVDVEYCLRLRENGYQILMLKKLILNHQIGNSKEVKFFGCHLLFTHNHAPFRTYYKIRNALYVAKKYTNKFPEESKILCYSVFKEILKIIILEDSKLEKLRFSIKGFYDYYCNNMGKLDLRNGGRSTF